MGTIDAVAFAQPKIEGAEAMKPLTVWEALVADRVDRWANFGRRSGTRNRWRFPARNVAHVHRGRIIRR